MCAFIVEHLTNHDCLQGDGLFRAEYRSSRCSQ